MTIKAVLLDLDDTLLHGGEIFVRTLIQDFSHFLHRELGLPDDPHLLIKAVREVGMNLSPTVRNDVLYRQTIAAADETLFEQKVQQYYASDYSSLQRLMRPDPSTLPLVEWLFEHEYTVIIATNPIYPQHGIEQRLSWAGLDPTWPFARITHAENSHFIKPHPHYYEEIMAHVGYEPYEAIMVGNDWRNDIVPAAKTGMRTYWVADSAKIPEGEIAPDGCGTLADFAGQLLQQDWLSRLSRKTPEPNHIPPRLIGSAAALMGMVEPMPERYWNQRPDPKEWTPLEVVAHVEDYERFVQRPDLELVAREHNPFIPVRWNPTTPTTRDLAGVDGYQTALNFAAERMRTVRFLENLPPEAWNRPARHSIYGPTTLLELASFVYRYDQLRIRQLCQIIGKCE